MWLVYTLISMFGWGIADLFYKKASENPNESLSKDSQWKISVWVGLVMGLFAFILLPFSETIHSLESLFINAVKYLPASLSYIVSMIIGYVGLKYLELSIISPVQNASGGLSMLLMLSIFLATGSINSLEDEFGIFDYSGLICIIFGVVFLAVIESKDAKVQPGEKKYKVGALALLFPLLYCVFDTIGTAADGIILNENTGLGLGEIDVLILYGFTFFIAGIVSWLIILCKNKKPYNPFKKTEKWAIGASLAEEFGQIFYVYAMAMKPMFAAPIIASYCIVSVLLARIFLKEKLSVTKWIAIIVVIIGIVLLGISEGLSNL